MTYEQYRQLFMVAAILGVILFLISLILFFVFRIPDIIGDLSGATAKKAINSIREKNEHNSEKLLEMNMANGEKGKLTEINKTQILKDTETTLLREKVNETTCLTQEIEPEQDIFSIQYDITFIHTNELIC